MADFSFLSNFVWGVSAFANQLEGSRNEK